MSCSGDLENLKKDKQEALRLIGDYQVQILKLQEQTQSEYKRLNVIQDKIDNTEFWRNK